MTPAPDLTALADAVADRLHTPPPMPPGQLWQAQSLADGAAGIALLHIERARTGHGSWATAHTWLRAATRTGIAATDDACLYLGAPALAFVLHRADAAQPGRYTTARHTVDEAVTALVHRRVDKAHARITRGDLPRAAEYDIIRGLTGIGAHLLHHAPGSEALIRILDYLVRLTLPLRHDTEIVPGWWTGHDPTGKTSTAFPGGHGNLGMAHGITGPLALLALALRRGIAVDGHHDAIHRICTWLDRHRRHHHGTTWWPQWVTLPEQRTSRINQPGPLRPSWCYGTPGIARAQQLAGIATGDRARQHLAEHSLADCLTDRNQLDTLADTSLCHGWAGLLRTVRRCARDAATTALTGHMDALTRRLVHDIDTHTNGPAGLLEGDAGAALALHAAADTPTHAGWDACLLLT
jgi:hypothetical protein